jgi:multisubunit Na+/H+ antiporter MnhE subunit
MPDFFEQVFRDEAGSGARKAARKPWWMLTAIASRGYLMAGLYFGMAIAALIASFFVEPIVTRMFAAVWLALSVWFLILAVVVLRDRTRR